jgi:predicted dehydrogenase
MKNFIIIGLGRLGVRHLQGLLKTNITAIIYCVELSLEAIEDAREKAAEVSHESKLVFVKDIPEGINFQIAIQSTNSSERYLLSKKLIETNKVEHLILEKVIFTKENEYALFSNDLKKTETKCWVNHVRRLYPHYQDLQRKLDSNHPISGSVSGSGWGLASNGLHFIDLFQFLSQSKAVKINTHGLNDFYPAKRKGYMETNGLLRVKFENSSTLFIYCGESEFNGVSINFTNGYKHYYINEGQANIMTESIENKIADIEPLMVTQTTSDITKELLSGHKCNLPSYSNIQETHELFVKTLNRHLQAHSSKKNTLSLKIT